MASTSTHIANFAEAIANGTIPGEFSDDRTAFKFPPIVYTLSGGAQSQWAIRVRLLNEEGPVPITDEMLTASAQLSDGDFAEITVESGRVGGKTRSVVPTYVKVGKNLGKKNETNALTQALRDALGLHNKQLKRAGSLAAVETKEEPDAKEDVVPKAIPKPKQFDPMPPPMLIKELGKTKAAVLSPEVFLDGATAQRKYNGVHLVAFIRSGVTVLYSRTSREYPSSASIVTELGPLLADAPVPAPGEYGLTAETPPEIVAAYADPRPYLDGELYLHGQPLNWISGQARRGDDKGRLEFHVFDVFFPYAIATGHNMVSRDRQAYLEALFAGSAPETHPHIVPVENFPVKSMEEVNTLAKQFLAEGYEGAVVRKDDGPYTYSYSNYHASEVIKIKPLFSEEYPVVGFTQGIKGKDVGAVKWTCRVPNPPKPRDAEFSVVPKDMTYEDRYALFTCLGQMVEGKDGKLQTRFDRDLKGLPLTVEFRDLSEDTKKPLQAKAVAFRTYEDGGPAADPVRRLLEECRAEAEAATVAEAAKGTAKFKREIAHKAMGKVAK